MSELAVEIAGCLSDLGVWFTQTAADGQQLQKAKQMQGNLQVPLEQFYNGHTFST